MGKGNGEEISAADMLDEELNSLYCPSEGWITRADCIPGHLYYGSGRNIGQVAICRGFAKFDSTSFEGIRNKHGVDKLDTEFHIDYRELGCTFTPFVDLGVAPIFETNEETMWWLLAQEIEVVESRIDWLKRIPMKLQASMVYPFLVQDNVKHLESLKLLLVEGFSVHTMPTFRQIMEARGLRK